MSVKIQQLGSLSPMLTGAVFDFLSPKEIAQIINRVQKSWSAYMSSDFLDLRSLSITDHDLKIILFKSKHTYPGKPLTRLALDYCDQLTFRSGNRISKIHSLTHLSLVECTNEQEDNVACGLRQMPHLVSLDLSGLMAWKPETIAKCSSLRELILKNCCSDKDFRALAGLSLEILDLSNNSEMSSGSVPYLNSMTSLKELDISETSIPPGQVERPGLEVTSTESLGESSLGTLLLEIRWDFWD